MEWTTKTGLVTCTMEADEFESLRETLRDARDTRVPLSLQNFPTDYAASLLDSMLRMGQVQGWEPWTPEEEAALEEAWRSWGHALTQRAFLQRLRAEAPHPVLVSRTDRAVGLHLAKMGLVKGRRPRRNSEQE